MAGAVFKWERLLVGERASMPFYAEFAEKLQLPVPEAQKAFNAVAQSDASKTLAAVESADQAVQGMKYHLF